MRLVLAVPIILAMVYRAWSRKTLTHAGIVVAILTAVAHAIHPWNSPFGLLIIFFLAGTKVTKIKRGVKSKLTVQASGDSNKESSRTHIQVLANSGVASVLSILHTYQLIQRGESTRCHPWPGDLLFIGIVANYAAVAADTFSSELGILSKSQPRLITSIKLRKVPHGTNGGVTSFGFAAALLGSSIIATASIVLTPFCRSSISSNEGHHFQAWTLTDKLRLYIFISFWGALGSLLDSLLGGWFQQSVVDIRSGKIIEGDGGKSVLVAKSEPEVLVDNLREDFSLQEDVRKTAIKKFRVQTPSHRHDRKSVEEKDTADNRDTKTFSIRSNALKMRPSRVVESGSFAWLDNNDVNFIMALTMSIGAMVIASYILKIPLSSLVP